MIHGKLIQKCYEMAFLCPSSYNLSIIASVNSFVVACPPISGVVNLPSSTTAAKASLKDCASFCLFNASSIIANARIKELGFAIPLPAISGALP